MIDNFRALFCLLFYCVVFNRASTTEKNEENAILEGGENKKGHKGKQNIQRVFFSFCSNFQSLEIAEATKATSLWCH